MNQPLPFCFFVSFVVKIRVLIQNSGFQVIGFQAEKCCPNSPSALPCRSPETTKARGSPLAPDSRPPTPDLPSHLQAQCGSVDNDLVAVANMILAIPEGAVGQAP